MSPKVTSEKHLKSRKLTLRVCFLVALAQGHKKANAVRFFNISHVNDEERLADQSILVLMMCDMRHWCTRHNISFDDALQESKIQFDFEQPFDKKAG